MSQINNPLLARFDGRPFLVSAEMQSVFESCLEQASVHLAKLDAAFAEKPSMLNGDDDFWFSSDDWRAAYRPYNVKDGILQIPVKGVLLHDFPYQMGGWATGYDYIWKAYERGMNDDNVDGIALVEDTPGGEVAGCFDAVDKMMARKEKPVRAFAMESAYSAGYAIASVADHIAVSRTGGVGSIGVITAHVEYSAALEKSGVKITFIHFGAQKKDGNPYEALSAEVKGRIQSRIDELGEVFVSTVARNRGMDEQFIRNTEAATFTATQAVSNGLANSIGSFDDAIAAFAADLSLTDEDETMTEEEKKAAAQAATAAAHAAAHAEGVKAGVTGERERITAIITSDAGAKRPSAAMAAALETDMTTEQATKFLAKLPEETVGATTPAADPKDPKGKEGAAADFAGTMNAGDHPNVGQPNAKTEDEKRSARLRAAAASAGRLKIVDTK